MLELYDGKLSCTVLRGRWGSNAPDLPEFLKNMTIEQENIIDYIGIEKDTNLVVLTLSDHLPWDNDNEHLLLLQNKLNSYLRFIESNELISEYPKAENKQPVIEVILKYSPIADGVTFLERVKET